LKGNKKFDARELGRALVDGFPALLMPVIILGGIYSGVFTATEAAVVSVVYGLIVGFFIYRQLKLKAVIKMLRDNAVFIGGTLLTIAPATAVAQVFSYLGVQSSISQLFLGISTSKYVIMIMIYAVLFVAGMFLQTTPCIVMLTPILIPIAQSVGVDAIQFGLVMVLALSIAFVTPRSQQSFRDDHHDGHTHQQDRHAHAPLHGGSDILPDTRGILLRYHIFVYQPVRPTIRAFPHRAKRHDPVQEEAIRLKGRKYL
jgi:hypothetical protein